MMMRPQIRGTVDLRQGEVATLGFFHEYAVSMALKAFEEGHQRAPYMTPTLWLLRRDNAVTTIETNWSNDHDKDLVTNALRVIMGAGGVTAYSLICEAWMATWRSDGSGSMKEQPGEGYMSVSGLPAEQREDVLYISSFDKSANYRLTRFGVARVDTPHARLKVRDNLDEGDERAAQMEGRMWNLLI